MSKTLLEMDLSELTGVRIAKVKEIERHEMQLKLIDKILDDKIKQMESEYYD